jgi:hypothetical protein
MCSYCMSDGTGWTYIHDDNHTEAYRTWSEGHLAVPSCPLLARQHHKRECWDESSPVTTPEQDAAVEELCGGGAYGDGCVDKRDFDAFPLAGDAEDSAGSEERCVDVNVDRCVD